jgi:hypothetical protein
MTAQPICHKCNRPLKDPTSVALGIGPECRGASSKKPNSLAARRTLARNVRTGAYLDGQPVSIGKIVWTKCGEVWKDQEGNEITDRVFGHWLNKHGFINSIKSNLGQPVIVSEGQS